MTSEDKSDILNSFYAARDMGIERLRRKLITLQELVNVSRMISTLELNTALQLIMNNIVRITQTRRGFLMLFDNEKNLQLEVTVKLNQADLESEEFAISQKIATEAATSGHMIIIENIPESKYQENLSIVTLGLKAIACIPIKTKTEVLGILYVDTNQFRHNLSNNDTDIYEAFGSQAAIVLENATLYTKLKKDYTILRQTTTQQFRFDNIISQSNAMKNVMRLMEQVLDNDIPVLIQGETGTGKEMIARAIHFNSLRQTERFMAQNCGALPDNLLESELFGYRKGAFTGANENRIGLFEAADKGTVFLDEIAEASPALQVRLLRLLEDGIIRRLGETIDRKVNVRIIAAANKDLLEAVDNGNFREDLYYRLCVFPIQVPPLRERKEDIPLLVHHFIHHYNSVLKKNIHSVSRQIIAKLMKYEWKGNIRELKNFIYRMMVLSSSDELVDEADLFENFSKRKSIKNSDVIPEESIKPLKKIEKEYIEYVLRILNGNQAQAARCLGLKRTTLLTKMAKLGVVTNTK